MEYTIYLISNKPEKLDPIKQSIYPETIHFWNGTGIGSFSKLVNTCVADCQTEIVIMVSDKVLPTQENIKKIISLIESGYAFVALYRFALFGFKKELMRQIGMLDERFTSGGHEDDDFYIRIREANLSWYVTEEANYIKSNSSWNYSESREFFFQKWNDTKAEGVIIRKLEDEPIRYNLGPSIPTQFKPFVESYATPAKISKRYGKLPLLKIKKD